MKKNSGFTLIELLAVILILGIISLIAIPTVNNILKESRRGSWESTANQMISSAESYYQICQIKDGKDMTGGNCAKFSESEDLSSGFKGTSTTEKATPYTGETSANVPHVGYDNIKSKLEFKGDTPSQTDLKNYFVDGNGKVALRFDINANHIACVTTSDTSVTDYDKVVAKAPTAGDPVVCYAK